jgi:hypothetical protein
MIHPVINSIALFLVPLVLACGASSALASQDQDTKTIDNFIAKQAQRLRGEEYAEARKVASGDLTHDGVAETVVLYTIEGQNGSNNYVQYLAVFTTGKGGLVAVTTTPVGGKLARSVELTSIADNTVQLATLSYGPNDGACCPSIKGTTKFILTGKTLREQKRSATRRQHK